MVLKITIYFPCLSRWFLCAWFALVEGPTAAGVFQVTPQIQFLAFGTSSCWDGPRCQASSRLAKSNLEQSSLCPRVLGGRRWEEEGITTGMTVLLPKSWYYTEHSIGLPTTDVRRVGCKPEPLQGNSIVWYTTMPSVKITCIMVSAQEKLSAYLIICDKTANAEW